MTAPIPVRDYLTTRVVDPRLDDPRFIASDEGQAWLEVLNRERTRHRSWAGRKAACPGCGGPMDKRAKRCITCHNDGLRATGRATFTSRNTPRKLAQRLAPVMRACERCGGTRRLQRHHPDLMGRPDVFVVLCLPCHTAEHVAMGTWAKKKRVPAASPQAAVERLIALVEPMARGGA